jgi:SAM-dependent methyltransferase
MSAWRRLSLGKLQFLKYLSLGKKQLEFFFGKSFEKEVQLAPPEDHLNFVGGGNFLEIGNEFFGYFRDLAGLKPTDRVLDVGCGIGRMAFPLTGYLSRKGSYEGFDIVPHGIQWCTEHITSRYPKFKFQLADIRNKWYNANGGVVAADFRFPYDDNSFDFVFLTSVFTHLLQREMENYISEIARVLKPDGCCFATWFFINEESEELMKKGRSTLDFKHAVEGCRTVNSSVPEEAVAYAQECVCDQYKRNGMNHHLRIHYGSWCGRTEHVSYQDILIGWKHNF